jgi:hypothetical protein
MCPVCSAPADATGWIYLYEYDSDALIPTIRALNPDKLRIPTCEDHAYTENEIANSKSLRAALLGMAIVIFLYFTIQSVLFLVQQISIPLWLYFALVPVVVLLVAYHQLPPVNELEEMMLIVDSGKGGTVTVRLKSENYVEEFLRLNPHAQRLSEEMVGAQHFG